LRIRVRLSTLHPRLAWSVHFHAIKEMIQCASC
jgi:hypothetical protein